MPRLTPDSRPCAPGRHGRVRPKLQVTVRKSTTYEAMENKSLLDWHSMFMGVALLAAARSKDARKRNGACIASSDYKILGVGYNGLPRGCDDDDPAYWTDDDEDPLHSRD